MLLVPLGKKNLALQGARYFSIVPLREYLLSAWHLVDRNQRQSKIANSLQQTVQGCLIDIISRNNGGAIDFVVECQTLEQISPAIVKMTLELDIIKFARLPVFSPSHDSTHS